jgi:quercetin dioxygenase-like cupin family protein
MVTARLAGFLLLLSVSLAVVAAQVPVHKDPSHQVAFENAQLRILSVNVPPGQTTQDHRHEFDTATVAVTSGPATREHAAGAAGTPRPARAAGDVATTDYTGKPASHRVENVGKTAYQLFAVENLKRSGWSTAPAAAGLATKLLRESRTFRLYDVRLGLNNAQSQHTHQVPTIVVLIAGKALSDGPDAQAKANAPAPVGLRQLDQPGQWILVPAGDTHHVVRLGTTDAHIVEIEVR